MIGEKVRREKPLDSSGCDSRPELVRPAAAPHCTHQPAGKTGNRLLATVVADEFALSDNAFMPIQVAAGANRRSTIHHAAELLGMRTGQGSDATRALDHPD